jgi:hypothetical protein
MLRLTFSLLVSLSLVGCPSDPAVPDASAPDAPSPDASSPDAPAADAFVALDAPDPADAPGCACTADQTCLRGVCVATCAGLEGVDASLAAVLVPVAHACRVPGPFDVIGTRVYELEAVAGSDGSTTLRLVRWDLDDGAVTPSTIAQRVYAPAMGELVFPGFVAANDAESRVVFGYTTTLAGAQGGVVDVTAASMTFVESPAPGNFDAAFVGGDDYLVNGQGFGADTGQGLYVIDGAGLEAPRVVVDGMGEFSGSVALWEEESLVVFGGTSFSGWPDATTGNLLFASELSAVLTGGLDAFADSDRFPLPSVFELLTGGRLVALRYDPSFAIDGVVLHQLARSPGGVNAGPEETLATGPTFSQVGAVEDDLVLVHAGGALRVRLP